jgi:hypothetical protein
MAESEKASRRSARRMRCAISTRKSRRKVLFFCSVRAEVAGERIRDKMPLPRRRACGWGSAVAWLRGAEPEAGRQRQGGSHRPPYLPPVGRAWSKTQPLHLQSLLRTKGRSIHEDESTTDPSFDAILSILSSWHSSSKASNLLWSSCRLGFPNSSGRHLSRSFASRAFGSV